MLAIAAPSFNAPSETFIRDHVRAVAPGRTILLCRDGTGADVFGCPVLADIDPWHPPKTLAERAVNYVRYRWRFYIDSTLRGDEMRRISAFLKAHNVKAVLAEYGPTGCLLMSACQEAGIPLFVHFHGYDANILSQHWATRMQYRRLFAFAARTVAASHFMKARLVELGCRPEKVVIIPCGVDTSRFKPNVLPKREGPVLMVSRLVAQKGPMLSLLSFAKAVRQYPTISLEIIGDGPLKTELKAQVRLLGISDRVHFHGIQNHKFVCERLSAARLLIQHCVSLPGEGVESFGLSILEAMASGLPVVATHHGAIPETVEHGITGILVSEYDVDSMADAIGGLLADPARSESMGAAGRARVLKHFTIEHASDLLCSTMGLSTTPLYH